MLLLLPAAAMNANCLPTGSTPALMSCLRHAKLPLLLPLGAVDSGGGAVDVSGRRTIACALTPLMPKELVPACSRLPDMPPAWMGNLQQQTPLLVVDIGTSALKGTLLLPSCPFKTSQ